MEVVSDTSIVEERHDVRNNLAFWQEKALQATVLPRPGAKPSIQLKGSLSAHRQSFSVGSTQYFRRPGLDNLVRPGS